MEPMVHVSRDGKVIGSYPLSAMRTMIDRGLVRLTDFYHMRGMVEWLLVEHGNFTAYEPMPEEHPRAPRTKAQPSEEAAASTERRKAAGLPLAAWATIASAVVVAVAVIGYLSFFGQGQSAPGKQFNTDLKEPLPEEYPSIRKLAAAGDVDAYVRLGMCELLGIGTEKSVSAAVASFRRAADKGHPYGQLYLGMSYLAGNGVAKDERAGFELIKKVADQGIPLGYYYLGKLYVQGVGTPRSLPQGISLIRRAADEGESSAQLFYGMALREGNGVAQNPAEAFRYLKLAADEGEEEDARYNLAEMYIEGEGVQEDLKEALRYLRLAEKQDHAESLYLLGRCYVGDIKGVVRPDAAVGVEYYRKAAAQGHVNALYRLGRHYSKGEGVAKSDVKSFEHFRKAATQGHATAQLMVGLYYRDGIGTEKSPRLAYRFFYESGMRENAYGAYHAALCLAKGEGVEASPKEAARFFRIACAGGHAEAYAEYAKIHFNGVGIVQDKTLAYAYGLVALAKGVESAQVWANINPADPTAAAINQEKGKALAKAILAAMEADEPIPTITPVGGREEVAKGGTGSGMVFTPEGHCFTNYHVVKGCDQFSVVPAGSTERLPADLVAVDKANDLAILKIRGWKAPEGAPSEPPPVVDSRGARAGDHVFTFGYPAPGMLSDAVKYTSGDINALSGLHGDQRLMQVSMPIQPGNSGGPVALDDGRVVGIVVSTVSPEVFFKNSNSLPQNVNFAVKADYLRILAQNNGLRLPTGSASGDAKQHVRAYSVQVIAE
jgi:TPR repeat protein